MFAIVAGLVFSAAFILAAFVIVMMLAAYRDKMIAALLFEPIPQTAPVYTLRVRRPRMVPALRPIARPSGALAA
ncbi:hypothetical protein WG908_02225 [Sphingobium sp. AN641]|uniref:hypothetical protein n=1 Tax=Sphingobium sp. AN641 TaxID=3133443 RepID=UPI0030C19683